MKVWRYSAWDGSQPEFRLDAEQALGALSDLLMEGMSVDDALAWMREQGFALGGLDFRVMGTQELLQQLAEQARELRERYRLDRSTAEIARRLDDILRREESAQRAMHGHESARMNDFLTRRHAPGDAVSERIERFRDHDFADEEAGEEFQELLAEQDRLQKLEAFVRAESQRFRGSEAADYETAQRIRERLQSLEQLARDLAEGRFERLSPEQLRELLSEDAARSLLLLRGLEERLREAGYLRTREGHAELTPRAIRRLGANALAEVYGQLAKARSGAHETSERGVALPRPDETRPHQFGDRVDLDVVRTLLAALRRRAHAGEPAREDGGIPLEADDLQVREADFSTETTTVLLLDMSWSMSWAGRFPAAKRLAIALDHLIRTRFPRDRFFVVGFSTRARVLRTADLPEAAWDMGDPFTNLQDALIVAERLVAKNPSRSPQLLVVTDGQPTAYFLANELHVEWPMGFGGISPRAAEETLRQVRRITQRGVTINTFMLDHSPELVGFVERMTRINRGRAFFTAPTELGSFVMVDYLAGRRRRSQA